MKNIKCIFKRKKEKKIEKFTKKILLFLTNNGIKTWTEFEKMSNIDKHIIYELIESEMPKNQISDIIFKLRIELSSNKQLEIYLTELENNEDYEKCYIVLKKISKLI